jgi:hypothetical protein
MLMKRTIPVLIAFVTGLWFAIQFFVPTDWSNLTMTQASNWVKILTGFAAILGLYSLVHLHWTKIRRKGPGWGYSALVYVGLLAMVILGLSGELQSLLGLIFKKSFTFANFQDYVDPTRPETVQYTYTSGYTWLFNYVYIPSSATMFSLLAFFIASAAYRTFRARSWQAAFLLIAAVVVMFGQVPLSAQIHESIPQAADWVMAYPNMAAKRGILLGVALGTVATALRIIFGIERAYLGGD